MVILALLFISSVQIIIELILFTNLFNKQWSSMDCLVADRGGENVIIADYMQLRPERGPGRGSFITGRRVHNLRFWRDLFQGCIVLYYNLFHMMEEGILDPDDSVHIFCLHYVFIKSLQHC